MTLYEDCKASEDEDGTKHLTSAQGILSVLPDGETRVFMRNFIKMPMGRQDPDKPPVQTRHRWLVGELDGVRVYVVGLKVILTKQDLRF